MSRQRLSLWCGGFLVLGAVITALVSLVWTPYDPIHAEPSVALQGPSWAHWFGTDRYGRDILSQLMAGAQISLLVSAMAVVVGAGIGIPAGIAGAVRGGWLDSVVMRTSDLLLAFPALLLAIIAGAISGMNMWTEAVAIGIAFIPSFARVARAGTVQILSQDYIAAARSAGLGWLSISWRHVARGIAGLATVQASVAIALAILAEAGLSFLGLGTPPPAPSWGRMVQASQVFLDVDPWLAVWPGAAIACTVLGFNLLGDGIRDVLDPTQEKRS